MSDKNTKNKITDSLVNWLEPLTKTGRSWFEKKIENTFKSQHSNDFTVLSYNSQKAKIFSKICDDSSLQSELLKISKLEQKIDEILKPNSELEKESKGELLFLGEYFSPINFIPYLLFFWSILRVYVLPSISMLIPFIILILPFLILKYLMEVPVTSEQYVSILKKIILKSSSAIPMGLSVSTGQNSSSSSILGIAPFIFSICQIVLQGYWTWKHLSAIDKIINENGETIIEFMKSYVKVSDILKKYGIHIMRPNWWSEKHDTRQIVAATTLYPVYLHLHLQSIGEVDVWIKLGEKIRNKDACVVNWVKSNNNKQMYIKLNNVYDTSCLVNSRIPVNYLIGGSKSPNHFLLTGPNRGGKSTALRSVAESVILSHTFGCSLGTTASMTPITHFSICLQPDDLPGLKSRFEREVDFAWGCLKKGSDTQLILIDELFHSTNPPDAEQASQIFTQMLWKRRNIISIISTHLFNFVDSAPEPIGRLCCPAEIGDNGRLVFSYKVVQGVCKVSSVRELINQQISKMDTV